MPHIHVRPSDKLRFVDSESAHDMSCHDLARLRRFAVAKHDLQLHERAQSLNLVEVDSGAVDQVKTPALSNPPNGTQRARQALAQQVGRRGWTDEVVTDFRSGVIGAKIVDQLASPVGKLTKLEPALGAGEERVVLRQIHGPLGRDDARPGFYLRKIADSGFDLDVSGHGAGLLRIGIEVLRHSRMRPSPNPRCWK